MKLKAQNIYLVFFIYIISNVYQFHCLKQDENGLLRSKYETIKSSNKVSKIRIPDAPKQVSNYVKLMQYELLKSYGLALKQFSPRFIQQDRNPNVQPFRINRDRLEGEEKIDILSAYSNSVFIEEFLLYYIEYPAENAIRDEDSYWCSTGQHKADEEVIFEVTFHKIERVHGLNMIFAYAPGMYKVEYSIDEKIYSTIVNWHNTIDGVNRGWWERLIPSLKQSFKSFPDRITFDHPVFAKTIRIKMKEPVNFYYGLYKVEFFTKEWVIMIRSAQNKKCNPDQCWSINEVKPKSGDKVKLTDCVSTIALSENRELFKFTLDGLLQHYESGLCVTTGENKDLTLMNCIEAKEKNDGREKFMFKQDGSLISEYDNNECISTKSKGNNLALLGLAEASSVSADRNHEAFRAIDNNANTFWQSALGIQSVTFNLSFSKWITADKLIINWKYPAREFEIFAMTYEKGWKHLVKIYNNYKTFQEINLKMINIRSIEIKMTKASEKIMNLSVYGISNINLSDGSFILSRNKCDLLSTIEKKFVYDEQIFYQTDEKSDFIKEMNKLANNFLKFRTLKQKIFSNWNLINQRKIFSQRIKKTTDESSLSLREVFERLRSFKFKDLKKVDTKYINVVRKYKLINSFKKSTFNSINSLGISKNFPAEDCSQIKKINKNKKTGFYWIKPRCSKRAMKVFCDFSIQRGGVSIYINNNDQRPNTVLDNTNINTFLDIRLICAKKGLYPIEIKKRDYVSRIFSLLSFLGWDLSLPQVIPLGHDYGCEKGKCENHYSSFNLQDSKNILSYFSDNDFDIMNSLSQKDSVGIGYSDELKPYFFNINEAKYTAIICSTNHYGEELKDPSFIKISCKDSLINKNFETEKGKTIKVKCPRNCHLDESKVYGDNRYSINSSICRAGIHSGVLNTFLGGVFEIKILPSQSIFYGKEKNEIKSEHSNIESSKTFVPYKVIEKCPIDYLIPFLPEKKRISSFLETQEKIAMESNSKFLSESELLELLSHREEPKKDNNEFLNLIQQDSLKANISNSTNNTSFNSSYFTNSSNYSNGSNNYTNTNNSSSNFTNSTIRNKNNKKKPKKKPNKTIIVNCKDINTDKAIIKVEEIRNIDKADVKTLQTFAENTNKLTNKFLSEMSWSKESSELSNESLDSKIKMSKFFISKMKLYENKILNVANARLKFAKKNHKKLRNLFSGMDKLTQYKINYKNIKDFWTTFNNKNSKQYPSNWSVINKNILGRKIGLMQSSKIKSNNKRIASIFYLKNFELFDFTYKIDIFTNSNKRAGIVFRMKDPYNFYALEFNQKEGYKKLFKSVDGVYTNLGVIKDGGLSQNQWFKVQIISHKETIQVKMGSDGIYEKYSTLPVLFKIEDNSLKSGSFGVFVNGNDKFYFDKVDIKPKVCWTPWKPNKSLKIIPNRSNIYEETYKQDIKSKYKVVNPQNQSRGPSFWEFRRNKLGKENIIFQRTEIIDKSPYREPTLLILKKKHVKRGVFTCDLRRIKKGLIGIVLRYVDKDNYYIFETGGNLKNNFFQIRKKIQGIMTTIKRINHDQILSKGLNEYAYNQDIWLRVKVLVNKNNFNIYISKPGYLEKSIFEFEVKELRIGRVGFTSFGTPAAFTNIFLRPIVNKISVSILAKDIQNVDVNSDVFVYGMSESRRKVHKQKIPNNKKLFTYIKCLENKTKDDRDRYCKETFFNNPIMRISCERSYCNLCCEKTVSLTDKLSLHHCKKICGSIKIKYEKNEEKDMAYRLCIQPQNPENSLYSHCENSFKNVIKRQNCKIDACRICCVSIDPIYHADQPEDNLQNCWRKCSKRFNAFNDIFK